MWQMQFNNRFFTLTLYHSQRFDSANAVETPRAGVSTAFSDFTTDFYIAP